MPEYLAPGVELEETSFQSKPIEGVGTTTTGFVGPTRYGPLESQPGPLTSLSEFEAVYGDGLPLQYHGTTVPHYLWHAARAFFENGGTRLYIARVFRPLVGTYPPNNLSTATQTTPDLYDDGYARLIIGSEDHSNNRLTLRSRFPGAAGNLRLRLTVHRGPNLLRGTSTAPTLKSLSHHSVVWIGGTTDPTAPTPQPGTFYLAEFDRTEQTWRFKTGETTSETDLRLHHSDPHLSLNPALGTQVRVISLTITVLDHASNTSVWKHLPLDPYHTRHGHPDSVLAMFTDIVPPSHTHSIPPLVITHGHDKPTGLDLLAALTTYKPLLASALNKRKSTVTARSIDLILQGGNDGHRPRAEDYHGIKDESKNTATGLQALEVIEDISIVAAPGSTLGMEQTYRADALTIANALVSHAERMRDRFAVLDSGDEQSVAQVRAIRTQLTSSYAALYYPWVRGFDPGMQREILLPPSGFVTGIYVRTDMARGVSTAPANEVIIGAIDLAPRLTQHEQELLNPEGINCLRVFEGRGIRLWGARTVSSDPEWAYVNVRRYLIYLEQSIDHGTQWVVFEPQSDNLWTTVRRMVEDFLLKEWRNGGLLGTKPDEAYFVKCDRSTMTQNDLDNGRLVCLIGVALLRPAEFVMFRIGQWTADHKP